MGDADSSVHHGGSLSSYPAQIAPELLRLPRLTGTVQNEFDIASRENVQPHAAYGNFRIGLETDILMTSTAVAATVDQETEPNSPLLRRCIAELHVASDDRPKRRLVEWRGVRDLDPRDLDARLAEAAALVDLNQIDEAKEIVDQLRAELPGNTKVARMWARLEKPWQMPEADKIRTRVERPWESGRDDRKTVLKLLVGEVTKIPEAVAARLQAQLESREGEVCRSAFDDEQAYLKALDEYKAAAERARRRAPFWRLGMAVVILGFAAVVTAAGVFSWLLLDLTGWPARPRAGVLLAGLIVLVAFVQLFWRWENTRAVVRVVAQLVCLFGVVAVYAVPIWLLIRSKGTVPGIVGGLVTAMVVSGIIIFGDALLSKYGPPSTRPLQLAFDRWVESLYGRGVLPAVAEASRGPETSYRTTLPAHCRILSEIVDELDTPATRELRRVLRQRSGGSFALAGPRGAGKSTLMERWCAGHFLCADDDRRESRHDLAVKVDAPVGYQSQEFLHHLFGQVCLAVEHYLADLPKPAQRIRRFALRRRYTSLEPAELTAESLRRRAAQERENIRYIHSRTTEGELSFGVPMAGAKSKISVQRSDVPLNHPELVGRFRDFLNEAAKFVGKRDGKVLIGIDELDRISDGDDAQRFINELKAVFNVPNCYFLVSVSEDGLGRLRARRHGHADGVRQCLRHGHPRRLPRVRPGESAAQPPDHRPARTVRSPRLRGVWRSRPRTGPHC